MKCGFPVISLIGSRWEGLGLTCNHTSNCCKEKRHTELTWSNLDVYLFGYDNLSLFFFELDF